MTQYAKIVEDLRQEVQELKVKIRSYEEGGVVATKSVLAMPQSLETER